MQSGTFIQLLLEKRAGNTARFPDKKNTEALIESLFDLLFAGNDDSFQQEESLTQLYEGLQQDCYDLVLQVTNDVNKSKQHRDDFFQRLPELYQQLLLDAQALLEFDPAARNIQEVILGYPGFFAIAVHRLAHQLYLQGIPTIPRLWAEYAHGKTGIDIHPGALIDESFAIDHGTGIVIGETAVIGKRVKIYQGVTLGALHVSKDLATQKRHPTIEDDVIIYAGATILGGSTIVGAGSIIGGNIWLTHSVAPNSVVYHKSEIKIKDKDPFPEPINFVI
jgi:serine O-acetyltransferase